jgi:glutamate synthase (NADPH) small chain
MAVKVPEQDPEQRVNNFDEVCLGYTEDQAIEEATRCLQCKNPQCVPCCPVNIDIPGFIKHIKDKNNNAALDKIKESSNLPGVCGRVCPQEKQCESGCILKFKKDPIAIGKLERYAADHGIPSEQPKQSSKNKKVAVIGSGPAGLTCASDLNRLGYQVTLFEALHVPGGVMMYGIPEFRLPKKIVQQEIDSIKKEGVILKTDYIIGKTLFLDELKKDYDAIFIANGAGTPYFMNIPGEDLVGVYSANEFLTRVNLMKAYDFPNSNTPIKKGKKVIVVGGGNVAMDAARTAKRLGADVTLVYRRSKEESPARVEEVHHAEEEGIDIQWLTNPIKIIGNNIVESMQLIKMKLGEPDSSGRRSPVAIEGSEFVIECDQIIIAIGQAPNPILTEDTGLDITKKGKIVVDENQMSSISGIFAGGDIIEGETTVIKAMGDGKKAAEKIHSYLSN